MGTKNTCTGIKREEVGGWHFPDWRFERKKGLFLELLQRRRLGHKM